MKRLHLIEIEDQDWCPRTVRDAATDYLQFALAAAKPYAAIIPILATALQRTGTRHVLDLCSGAAGPWPWLHPGLAERGVNVSVCLTDKYPNIEAFGPLSRLTHQAISYHPQPVDATRVPSELPGLRTMFTAFHHFRPEQACAVLADAVMKRQGIGVFEATQRRPLALLLTLPAPLAVLVVTPFIRPFRWSRLFWTYLIPLVPLVTLLVYLGLRFTEVSFSVRAVLNQGSSSAGMRLLHAFTSSRVFAWCERTMFTTPSSHGECHVSADGPPAVRLDAQGERVLSAEMSSVERPALRAGDESWEGPVFLPPRGTANDSRLFFGRLRGHAVVYPFSRDDRFAIEASAAGGVLKPLADSGFYPQEWLVRADATHGKSKTYRRTDVFTHDHTA